MNNKSLPYSSVNVEGIFLTINILKTSIQSRLRTSTLESILFTKSFVSEAGNYFSFKTTQKLVQKMDSKDNSIFATASNFDSGFFQNSLTV